MKKIIVLCILLVASFAWAGPSYKMIVVSGSELYGDPNQFNEPTIMHDVYPMQASQTLIGETGILDPNALLIEIVVDNDTATQIFADGSYLVLQSTLIQPGGPDAEPITPDPNLTILPDDIPNSDKLSAIASGLASSGLIYDGDGNPGSLATVISNVKCPGGLKGNCIQQQDAARTMATSTSASQIQSLWDGKSVGEIIETLKVQMRNFPSQASADAALTQRVIK